ncbi:MAG: polysaccharide deacetylase, partial [Candidatus Tectomicrobia bacterium]|nr:polysaccharide deacetylase [Candidatus Tectomicrobia bacterium]
MISSKMSEQDERDYIQTSIQALKRATGQAPAGWLGPEYGESARTPQLLAQAGLRYVCDWANDEQPYRMKTAQGELFALPIMLELDDLHAMGDRRVPVTRYADMLREGFERLYRDGARNGRLLVLHLHPWLSGQPFRIRYLDGALGTMLRRQGVWAAHGAAIIDWYRRHPPATP